MGLIAAATAGDEHPNPGHDKPGREVAHLLLSHSRRNPDLRATR